MARSPHDARTGDDTILGVDVGGTKTSLIAVARATGDRIASASFSTPPDHAPDAFVALLHRQASAMLAQAGIDTASVRAIGCAIPGQVDGDGTVIGAGNLGDWSDVPLRTKLEERWEVPAFVDQDANAGALGELWRGAAMAMRDFVFLALGTGIGAGIVIGGRIHRGFHHAAGEAGDLVVETRALGHGDADTHNLASHVGSRALRKRSRALTGAEVRPADAVLGAAIDPRLGPLARDATRDLAVTVIAIAALIDPEAIVFGGGTSRAGDALLDAIRERVKRELWTEPKLVLAALGEHAQLYGAVAGALSRLDPSFAVAHALRRHA